MCLWYHVAVVRNGNTFKLYINGISEATYTNSATIENSSTNTLALGSSVNTSAEEDFYGYIDDLRITKGIARYTSNFTPAETAMNAVPSPQLPSALSNTNLYTLKNISPISATVVTSSSQTINGSSSYSLVAGSVVNLISDGSNWRTV